MALTLFREHWEELRRKWRDTCHLHASVANTNVVSHAGKTLAVVESTLPHTDH